QSAQAVFDANIKPEPGVEYFVNINAALKKQDGLIDAGTVLASEQFLLPVSVGAKNLNLANLPAVTVDDRENSITVQGEGFSVAFDKVAGLMNSYNKGDTEYLEQGPVPNFWRAPIDNDFGNNLHKRSRVWREAGKNRKVTDVVVK